MHVQINQGILNFIKTGVSVRQNFVTPFIISFELSMSVNVMFPGINFLFNHLKISVDFASPLTLKPAYSFF